MARTLKSTWVSNVGQLLSEETLSFYSSLSPLLSGKEGSGGPPPSSLLSTVLRRKKNERGWQEMKKVDLKWKEERGWGLIPYLK